ncbi:unnamed protein product [Boreogadus saida]
MGDGQRRGGPMGDGQRRGGPMGDGQRRGGPVGDSQRQGDPVGDSQRQGGALWEMARGRGTLWEMARGGGALWEMARGGGALWEMARGRGTLCLAALLQDVLWSSDLCYQQTIRLISPPSLIASLPARLIKATSLWITDTELSSLEGQDNSCGPAGPGAFKWLLSDDDSQSYRRRTTYEQTKLLTMSALENLLAGGTV